MDVLLFDCVEDREYSATTTKVDLFYISVHRSATLLRTVQNKCCLDYFYFGKAVICVHHYLSY